MRSAEEKLRAEEERRSRHPEKFERKNAERLERAKKRCEQIRSIISSFDPANLNNANSATASANASTSSVPETAASQPTVDAALAVLGPSAETIRLLSNAIAGCLQPCNLINKILNEIIGMVPLVPEVPAQTSGQASSDQQQQTEVPRQNTATNTSDLNTPTAAHPSNQQIEALFKEAAKELEKMNEIVNNGKPMESSDASTSASFGSSMSAITQVEQIMKNFTDSVISDSTVVDMEPADYEDQTDSVGARAKSPDIEHDYKIVTPPKSMRSRESSIEVHDENSMISDDSRDWTILDAHTQETEDDVDASFTSAHGGDFLIQSSLQVEPSAVFIDSERESSSAAKESIKSFSAQAAPTQEEVRASIQKSIETVGEMSEIVKNSVAMAQESLKTVQQPEVSQVQPVLKLRPEVDAPPVAFVPSVQFGRPALAPTSSAPQAEASAVSWKQEVLFPAAPVPTVPSRAPPTIPARTQPTAAPASTPLLLRNLSATTQANLMANRYSGGAKPKAPQMGPAVIVYDPNPKINASVYQMLNMGFTNEGE